MRVLSFSDDQCVDILLRGEVLAFPTETVFGFGVRYDQKAAYDRLVAVKRRSPTKPFTLMGADTAAIHAMAEIDERIERIILAFMPGPITVLLKPKEGLYPQVSLESGKVGFRIPAYPELRKLIARVGLPLLVPSANREGEKPALSVTEIVANFEGEISAVVSGNVAVGGLPSTIIDLSVPGEVNLVRQGELSLKRIMEVYKS